MLLYSWKHEQSAGNSFHWSVFGPGITILGFTHISKWILPGKQEVTKADVCQTQLPISPQVAKSLNLLSGETTTVQSITTQAICFRAQHSFITLSQPSTLLQTHIIKPQLIIKYLTKTVQFGATTKVGRAVQIDFSVSGARCASNSMDALKFQITRTSCDGW